MKLDSPVSTIKSVGPSYQKLLEKLSIEKVEDLINHIPFRYDDYSLISDTQRCQIGEVVTIRGQVVSLKNQRTRRGLSMQIGAFADEKGRMPLVFFNQPFLVKMLYPGQKITLSGKVQTFSGKKAFVSPSYEIAKESGLENKTAGIIPVYPETEGLTSTWIRGKVGLILKEEGVIEEFLPNEVLKKYKLESLLEAYKNVHFPKEIADAGKARHRLAFNELLMLHLRSVAKKLDWEKRESSYKLKVSKSIKKEFIESLPFKLTSSQEKAIEEVSSDLTQQIPMNRLLEGDVGSGKTVIAAFAAFNAFINGCQTVFMAPTQILASQHYETLNKLLSPYKIRISLITSSIKKIDLGRSDIFIGTHALIHSKVDFDKVALVVIDEQHRFGVEQRKHLVKRSVKKTVSPHVLTMTATPIPRTIALTMYGDLDLSILNEMPAGRQKVTTWVVSQEKRKSSYSWIEKEIKENNSQAFIICPLIEESQIETMQNVKAVKKEFEVLKKVFKSLKLGLLHGKLTPKEKDEVLGEFKKGNIDILVSTPVVEVGIDIPNATIMAIEASERFGLAQLHQLRGRVGRGIKKSYCLLFSETKSSRRLTAMTKTNSGLELAELDLKLRGPGEILGTRQHGFDDLKAASWSDFDLIKSTKEVADEFVKNSNKYPKVQDKLQKFLHVA